MFDYNKIKELQLEAQHSFAVYLSFVGLNQNSETSKLLPLKWPDLADLYLEHLVDQNEQSYNNLKSCIEMLVIVPIESIYYGVVSRILVESGIFPNSIYDNKIYNLDTIPKKKELIKITNDSLRLLEELTGKKIPEIK